MQKITKEKALTLIESKSCQYYDHISETMAEWRNHLENSEVAKYTFIADNLAINHCDHCLIVKKYDDNCVYTWTFSKLTELIGDNGEYITKQL